MPPLPRISQSTLACSEFLGYGRAEGGWGREAGSGRPLTGLRSKEFAVLPHRPRLRDYTACTGRSSSSRDDGFPTVAIDGAPLQFSSSQTTNPSFS